MQTLQSLKPTVTSRGVETLDFASVDECLAAARVPTAPQFNSDSFACAQQNGNGKWCGTETFAEADRLAIEGWPEGLAMAEKMRAQLCGVMGSRAEKPRLTRGLAGFSPCVPAAIAGDPENMFTTRKVETLATGKIVKIVYNNCVSSGISAKIIALRGAVCLALVDTLESCGFRCEVVIGNSCRQGGENPFHQVFITLKQAQDHMAIDTLAFWIVHPAAYRRMIFSVWMNAWPSTCQFPGLGQPAEVQEPDRKGDIYLNEAHLAYVNNETAIPFLKAELAKFGVEFDS